VLILLYGDGKKKTTHKMLSPIKEVEYKVNTYKVYVNIRTDEFERIPIEKVENMIVERGRNILAGVLPIRFERCGELSNQEEIVYKVYIEIAERENNKGELKCMKS
jgi:hypothetical protein